MTDIRIHNPIERHFAMVPDVLWRWTYVPEGATEARPLSFHAKALMAYLLSHRHGTMPPVAAQEAESGLGRKARQAAMRQLTEARLAYWEIKRDRQGRVLAKTLVVTTAPLVAAAAAEIAQESAEVHEGRNGSHGVHEGRKRSDGFRASAGVDLDPQEGRNGSILKKQKEKDKPAALSSENGRRPAASEAQTVRPERLTAWQQAQLRAGETVTVDGVKVPGGSDLAQRLLLELRHRFDAEKKAVRHA